ncbi:MAG: UDP-3-O-(3-hydroxymyristoyl)glucosamine N-acyltransferase, partial [Betaproteobacteria bacterium]
MPPAPTLGGLVAAVQRRSAQRLRARVLGADDVPIFRAAPLDSAGAGDLSFLANPRYAKQLASTGASAVVLRERDAATLASASATFSRIFCDQPYAWFAFAAQELAPATAPDASVAASARIDPSATIDAGACIEDFVAVGAGARIEAGAWIGAGCIVGMGARVGAGTRLHPRVVLAADCSIGERGIVHSGAVIGADGFGFAPLDGRWIKIPQPGRVLIGDDVEIGANTTIDRGAIEDTVLGDDVKLDNQIQIGHNCVIGDHTIIAGCTGVAGSTLIGKRVMIGGAVSITGHLSICDDAVLSANAFVTKSIS